MGNAEDIKFHPWNTTYIFTAVEYSFLYFTAVKYSFFKICITFNKYFPVFHYFVYKKKDFPQPIYHNSRTSTLYSTTRHNLFGLMQTGLLFHKTCTTHNCSRGIFMFEEWSKK